MTSENIALENLLWAVGRDVMKGNASEAIEDAYHAYVEACAEHQTEGTE